LVSYTKGKIEIEGCLTTGVEENVWTEEGENGWRLEKTA
jgi:hypothetical protein